jgi:hypothetical protein
MNNLRFFMMDAIDCGINEHPQAAMRRLGITYERSVPQSLGDQWWFYGCENIPDELPPYLSKLETDPVVP